MGISGLSEEQLQLLLMMRVKRLTDGLFPNSILVPPEVFLSSYFKLLTPSHNSPRKKHHRKKEKKNRTRGRQISGFSSASYGGVSSLSLAMGAFCGLWSPWLFRLSRPDRGKRWQQRRQWMNHNCHVGPSIVLSRE